MTDSPTGLLTAYDLTTGVVVNVDEAIYMISPVDSPMITGVNADGLSLVTMEGGLDQIEFSWFDEEILTPRSLVSATIATTDTYITVTVGERTKFSTGDLLRLVKSTASEYVRVTAYGSTADTLVVTRGFDGTTATNFAANDKVRGVGTALPEGSDPERARAKDRDKRTNNTQIFGPTAVHMSRTDQRIRRYGVGTGEFAKQTFNRINEIVIAREYAAIYGRKYNSTDSKIRTTGGMAAFITSNQDTTSTILSVLAVQALQQKAYLKGMVWDTLAANPASLIDLNDIANTSIVRTTEVETMRGRRRVSVIVTEYGDVTIARNRWMEPQDAFGFSRQNFKRKVMDPMQIERLAKTGDSDKVQIVCEEGWQFKGQSHMGRFSALSYSTTE